MRALRRRQTVLDRRALVRALVRITLKRLVRYGGRSERFLGYRVAFDDYPTFALLFEEIFVNEQYRLPPGGDDAPFVIDAGANIGMATLYVKATHPGARVLAIEPDPDAWALLRANLARNGLQDVEVVQAALGSEEGTTTLYRDRPGSVLATTAPGVFHDAVQVPLVRLSPRVEPGTALVKLDIEGAEAAVLGELAAGGRLAEVRALAIEVGLHHPTPDEHGLGRVLSLLEEHGFTYAVSAPYLPPLDERAPQNVLVRAVRA